MNLQGQAISPAAIGSFWKQNVQTFISYSRADWTYVQKLACEFRCAGIATWVDIENIKPGDQWRPTIHAAIRASRAFVFCISPFSLESSRTSWELAEAVSLGLIVFPVMIDPTPIEKLPEALKERQILELFREPPLRGPKRAARELRRMLGMPFSRVLALESDRDAIDVLVLRLGDFGAILDPNSLLGGEAEGNRSVVEKTVAFLDRATFASITEWLKRCSLACIFVGNDARADEVGLICGLASAILGSKRVVIVSTLAALPVASKVSQLLLTRLVECGRAV
jgi:hypothetical protein